MKKDIISEFKESAELKEKFVKEYISQVIEVTKLIIVAYREGKKLILFGNGGSAADASHIAGELVNRFKKDRAGLPAISLNTDTAVITSIANDYDYSEVFARQINTLGKEGDIAIAISTSGNSPSVIKGAREAKKKGIKTIGLTGGSGGKLATIVDYPFVIPSWNTPRIQEVHMTLGHVICQRVEEEIFGRGKGQEESRE